MSNFGFRPTYKLLGDPDPSNCSDRGSQLVPKIRSFRPDDLVPRCTIRFDLRSTNLKIRPPIFHLVYSKNVKIWFGTRIRWLWKIRFGFAFESGQNENSVSDSDSQLVILINTIRFGIQIRYSWKIRFDSEFGLGKFIWSFASGFGIRRSTIALRSEYLEIIF